MLAPETRTEAQVAALWGVSRPTVARQRQNRAFIPDGRNATQAKFYYYLCTTVDSFMSARAQGLHVPAPTVEALESGKEQLLSIEDVIKRLGVKENVVHYLIKMGDIGKIDINPGHVVRVPASEVAHYEHRTGPEMVASTQEAADLFCLSLDAMRLIMHNPDYELVVIDNLRGRGCGNFVTRASLNALLKRCLYGPATLEQWYRWTLHDRVEILSVVAAHRYSGMTQHAIEAHLAAGELAALHTGDKDFWRIPLPALRQLMWQRERYTVQRLADLFAITRYVAQQWLTNGTLCQRAHSGAHYMCPNQWCLEAFVDGRLTPPGESAPAWLEARRNDPRPLVSLRDLQDSAWHVTPQVIAEALDRGILHGIWLPGPNGKEMLRVTHASAAAFVRWRDRAYSLTAQTTRR